MKVIGMPNADGFYMPAEFSEHSGCIMIWPYRAGSWPFGAVMAQEAFKNVACAISESEKVYMLCDKEQMSKASEKLKDCANIELIEMASDDAWARDVAPTFVVCNEGVVRGIDWCFNAWGGEVDSLYASWDKDNLVASSLCDKLGYDYYDAKDFVLEGGSIHSDGEGTIMVTEACLLSKGRNPEMSKKEIEDKLKQYLGAEKIIWLPYGIYMDETNEHVDNVCAFTKAGEVVLAWTDDENDPQYAMSMADLQVLENETDAKGRKFTVHKLLVPKNTVCIKEEELAGYDFAIGEDEREVGERLAASYVNFYIANDSVVVPQFDDEHDELAVEVLQNCFKDKKIVAIKARDILLGGGNIHCITQQIPKGVK